MAVYTDGVHMVADSLEELHEFATRIALSRSYFEGVRKGHPHYDLTNERRREMAYEAGAVKVSSREILIKSKALSNDKSTITRKV